MMNPQHYIWHLMFMNKELERVSAKENPVKLFNVVPLRTSIISSHTTFDTDALVRLMLNSNVYDYYCCKGH